MCSVERDLLLSRSIDLIDCFDNRIPMRHITFLATISRLSYPIHVVTFLLFSMKDAGVHALSNVCHVDVERISKRKPGEVVCPFV